MADTLQQRAVSAIYGVLGRDPEGERDPLVPTMAALGADSLDVIEIAFELEEQFDIEISDDEAEPFSDLEKTVGDWWLLIAPKLGSAAA